MMSLFLQATVCKLIESNLRTPIRCYARWSHRRPRKVLTSEEFDQLEAQQNRQSDRSKPSRYAKESHQHSQKVSVGEEYVQLEHRAQHNLQSGGSKPSWSTKESHRHPQRASVAKEYVELDHRAQQSPKRNKEKSFQRAEEKIIELDAETVVRQQSKVNFVKAQMQKPQRKWLPKSLGLDPREAIINMDELDRTSGVVEYKIEQKAVKRKRAAYTTKKNYSSQTPTDMLETIIDANGDFIYTKLKDNDPVISQVLLTVKSRNEQIKKDLALLEGRRLIKEALEAKCTLKNLIFSRKSDIEHLKPYLPKSGAKIYKMPYREIQMWSDLSTTPGIMGVFKTPEVENYVSKDSLKLSIVCDNVREPGNLGAILRTAAAVGAQSVILTKGCVDLWDTKVLRSACGAHFRLQIHKKMDWAAIKAYLNKSANTVLIADNKIVTENSVVDLPTTQDGSLDQQQSSSLSDIISSIPLLPYYGVSFGDLGRLVLIVGGETEGISEESYRVAAGFDGLRLNIPLSNDVDSLNTGTALGVIMFEIKRQLALVAVKKVEEIRPENNI